MKEGLRDFPKKAKHLLKALYSAARVSDESTAKAEYWKKHFCNGGVIPGIGFADDPVRFYEHHFLTKMGAI